MARLIAALWLAASFAGCAGREMRGARCEWSSEPSPGLLDLKNPTQLRHLRDDARSAELLAVTYADSIQGLDTFGQHRHSMERCEGMLLSDIARVHHVTPEQVRMALRRQNDTPY